MDDYSVYAQFYDLDHGDVDADLVMIEQLAALCGSPILELACGTGRALLPLARQGYQVTGVDISPEMLTIAQRKVDTEGLADRVTLIEQDMRRLTLDGCFNLAFIALNSFMHLLTPDDQVESLVHIRHHLNPGGRLLLDLFNPDLGRLLDFRGQVSMDKVMVDPETGHRLIKLRSEKVDLSQQTVYVTYMLDDVDEQGVVRRTLVPFSIRYLFRSELEHLLHRAGFAVEAIYGSYDLDDFCGDSDKMITVARRLD
ncbi:MAG: class I SAM-dependent methyltransferase [Anaerolineae bacterium]|nr:class I SAM-dependent methyltransferase [Anaerolineae bacterium]